MFEAAQLVNQMPIGRHATHSHDGSYPCPNDLLLGRASLEVPQGPFMERVGDRYRLDFIQRIVQSFWKKRTRDYFPALIMRLKKHMERRNVKERKVMLIQDSNLLMLFKVIRGLASLLKPIPATTTKFNSSLYHTRMVSG